MPKAILAIRTYPATLLLALALFMATLVMTAASMGKVGTGGGDDGDGGSGIGGTGKTGEFGGSGFGGTGGPSPFVTGIDQEEQAADQPFEQDPVDATSLTGNDSIAVNAERVIEPDEALHQALSDSIEQSLLVLETDDALMTDVVAQNDNPTTVVTESKAPERQLVEVLPNVQGLTQTDSQRLPQPTYSLSQGPVVVVAPTAGTQQPPLEIAIENTAQAETSDSIAVKLETAAEQNKLEVDRNNLPDRIQRPDLPPFQRVRPLERVSIMAPVRVQPMRI